MRQTIRILIVSDDSRPLPAPDSATSAGPELVLAGRVPVSAAGRWVSSLRPDLVIVRSRGARVAEVLLEIRRVSGSTRILVETEGDDPDLLPAILAAGGCGVVAGDVTADAMREAIVRAHAGELVVDDENLKRVVRSISEARSSRRDLLTERELEVLSTISQGLATSEIATALEISPGTVQAHVKNVLAKLGVHSKVEAVRVAWREGLVAVPA